MVFDHDTHGMDCAQHVDLGKTLMMLPIRQGDHSSVEKHSRFFAAGRMSAYGRKLILVFATPGTCQNPPCDKEYSLAESEISQCRSQQE